MAPGFSVRVRWRMLDDPRWEVETEHAGFGSPEEAALFANGFGEAAAGGLEIVDGRCRLLLTDGGTRDAALQSAWRLRREPPDSWGVVADEDFDRRKVEDLDVTDGEFQALRYCVLGDGGAVDVKVSLDEEGHARVTVYPEPEPEDEGVLVLLPT